MSVLKAVKFFIIDAALWFFFIPFRVVLKALPLKFVYALSNIAGGIINMVIGKKVSISCRELLGNCPDKTTSDEIKEISKKSIEIYIKRHFEDLILPSFSKETIASIVTIEGIEHIDNALARGKGIIIQLAHFGSFLMILPALAYRGYKVNQIVGKPELKHHRKIHKLIFNAKAKENSALPVRFVHVDHSIRPVIDALKKNELIAVAFDGRDGKDWVPVKFLGGTANISPGAVRIARVTGAAILPTFIIRQHDDTHRLIIERPIELEQSEDMEEFLSKNIQNIADIFEKYIVKYPCHFGMTYHTLRSRAEKGIIDKAFFQKQ